MRAIVHVAVVAVLCLISAGCQSSPSPLAPSHAIGETGDRSIASHLFTAPRLAEGDIVKACFLVTVVEIDNRADVVKTIRGNNSLLDLIEGRDQETAGGETWFNRFVLKPSLLPVGTPEIPVIGGMGINTNVAAVVRNEINDNRIFWWTIEPGTQVTYTRQTLQALMITEAKINRNCTHYWQIVPGDALTVAAAGQAGDLLSKFLPLP